MGFLVTTTIIGTVGSSAVSTVSSRTTYEGNSTSGTGTDKGGMSILIWIGLGIGIILVIIIFKMLLLYKVSCLNQTQEIDCTGN